MSWTISEVEYLAQHFKDKTHQELAESLGKTEKAVRNKCYKLGFKKLEHWTDEELSILIEAYTSSSGQTLNMSSLVKQLSKTKYAISIKAKQLGLTERNRPVSEYVKHSASVSSKAHIDKNGHPKGMKGKKHSKTFRNNMSTRVKNEWASPASKFNTPEFRQGISDRVYKQIVQRVKENPESIRTRAAGGTREDLGRYFRSSWEANYARYLNFLRDKGSIKDWEYEVDTFWFEKIKRGTRSYTPDFKVWSSETEYEYHEVKGYMDQKSKTKLDRMKRYYPNEKVIVIGESEYKEIKRWSGLIPNWETVK